MFKLLRLRLLILNLSLITLVMLAAFSVIYVMTDKNIKKDITEDLHRLADIRKDFIMPRQPSDDFFSKAPKEFIEDRFVSFVIMTDATGDIQSSTSTFTADETFYIEALNSMKKINVKDAMAKFELEDSQWAFLVRERPTETLYAVIDMTPQQDVLDRLIMTFMMVTFIMVIVIFFISNYLTERSITPIRDAFDKQKQFISDASHELKTPLAVIGTNVDVLLAQQTDSQAIETPWLKYIRNEVDRMGRLTKDLLYLTQMEASNEQSLLFHRFNLSEKVEIQLLGLEVFAYEKRIQLDYDIEPNIFINGITEQIIQVVIILIDNAIKYSPEGKTVTLTLRQTSHHVFLSIKNEGDGISAQDLPHIFDRFYRVDKARSRTTDSHGLGLSIAKAIITTHHGKIWCESTPGGQTIFTVKLRH